MFQKNWGIEKIYAIWGVSQFFVEIFLSHSGEKLWGHPFNVSENLRSRKSLCIIGGITIFRRKIFVSQCRKLLWASLQCFRKIELSKNFMHKRGYHVFPSKFFGLTVPKILWASLQCFRNFEVLKKFMHNRGYHSFLSKFFCLTVPKNFMGIPSIFQKFRGIEKFHALMGYHNFPSKKFCLTVPKNFVRESYCFWENFWFQKVFLDEKARITFLLLKILVSQCRKISRASPQCFRKIGVLKKSMLTRGYHVFSSKHFFVPQCRKISGASLQSFKKFGVSKSFMHLWGITFFRRKFFVSQFRKIS